MRKFYSICILVLLSGFVSAQESIKKDATISVTDSIKNNLQGKPSLNELVDLAASDYSQKEYTQAAEIYQTIIARYGNSAEIEYNLGNAYFKSNQLAPAILHFERALKMNPLDDDIRFNLQMCNARIVDQITPLGQFFVGRLFYSLGQMNTSNNWAWTSIVLFILFIICFGSYFLARRRWLKKTGFYVGIVSFLICILAFVYAWQGRSQIENSKEAILFSLSVTVKSSPDKSGTDLFVLHEGIKVKIKSTLGDWYEIELADGNIGWLQAKDLQII